MRQAIGNDALDLGFKLDRKRSGRHNPDVITDLDFADDIALVTEELEQAQDFLHRVQENAAKIGLHLNSDKTESLCKSLKLRTFLTLIESVLLHGSETWTLTKN